MTILHCTCRAIRACSWSGKANSGGNQACRSPLSRGGQASGSRSRHRQYLERCWIIDEHGTTGVWHWIVWCSHCWALDICCNPARGVAWHVWHNLHVHSLDTHTKNRHAARDDVGLYALGNLQAMLLKPVCNAWSCNLHREICNTCSWSWDYAYSCEAKVPARVPCSAPMGLFTAAQPAASEEHFCSWSESAGERPLWRWVLRVCGGSSKIDCLLSYIQRTVSCQ